MSEIQTAEIHLDFFRVWILDRKKASEIRTVWKRGAIEPSEIQTSSDFRHSLYLTSILVRISDTYCMPLFQPTGVLFLISIVRILTILTGRFCRFVSGLKSCDDLDLTRIAFVN